MGSCFRRMHGGQCPLRLNLRCCHRLFLPQLPPPGAVAYAGLVVCFARRPCHVMPPGFRGSEAATRQGFELVADAVTVLVRLNLLARHAPTMYLTGQVLSSAQPATLVNHLTAVVQMPRSWRRGRAHARLRWEVAQGAATARRHDITISLPSTAL